MHHRRRPAIRAIEAHYRGRRQHHQDDRSGRQPPRTAVIPGRQLDDVVGAQLVQPTPQLGSTVPLPANAGSDVDRVTPVEQGLDVLVPKGPAGSHQPHAKRRCRAVDHPGSLRRGEVIEVDQGRGSPDLLDRGVRRPPPARASRRPRCWTGHGGGCRPEAIDQTDAPSLRPVAVADDVVRHLEQPPRRYVELLSTPSHQPGTGGSIDTPWRSGHARRSRASVSTASTAPGTCLAPSAPPSSPGRRPSCLGPGAAYSRSPPP